MKKIEKKESQTPEEEIKTALETLYEIIFSYEPKKCHLTIDGVGSFGEIFNDRNNEHKTYRPQSFSLPPR